MDSLRNEINSRNSDESLLASLREVWNSMFNSEIVRPLQGDNTEIQATVMLLETAIFNIKRFGLEVVSLQTENKKITNDFNNAKKECLLLKEEIESLKSAECSNCAELMKKILRQRQEISDTKGRIQSIASILNIGQTITNPETQNALMLVNEMLVTADEDQKKSSPVRGRKNKHIPNSPVTSVSPLRGEIIVPETVDLDDKVSPVKNIVIPETQGISPRKSRRFENVDSDVIMVSVSKSAAGPSSEMHKFHTPKKDESKKRPEDTSPILERSAKRKKGLSARVQNEIRKSLVGCLSQELTSDDKKSLSDSCTTGSENRMSPSILVEKLPRALSPKKKSPNKTKSGNSKWALKPGRYVDDVLPVKCDKKLKQTTLLLKPVEFKKDITKLKNFNGGVHSSSSESVEIYKPDEDVLHSDDDDDDADIIQSSPAEKKLSQLNSVSCSSSSARQKLEMKGNPVLDIESMDETVFHPLAASTCKMDSSFDRIPGRERKSPDFKYQRDPVRKKAERMQLEGWDCDNCAKYYQSAYKNMKPADLKKQMNRCSRHRNKFPVRTNTPPGFWDPEFPPSDDEDDEN